MQESQQFLLNELAIEALKYSAITGNCSLQISIPYISVKLIQRAMEYFTAQKGEPGHLSLLP